MEYFTIVNFSSLASIESPKMDIYSLTPSFSPITPISNSIATALHCFTSISRPIPSWNRIDQMSIPSTRSGLNRHFGNDEDRGREIRLLVAKRSGWRIWPSIKRPDQLVGRLFFIFLG